MAIPIRHTRPERIAAGARTFFISSSTTGRRNLLQSDRSARLFISVLYEYRSQGKFRLHDFVVMPEHFHVLLTIEAGITIERAVQFIKGGFAFRAGKEFGMKSPLWQKGFHDIRVWSPEHYERLREYIHCNPVKKWLVIEPWLYPYSSANSRFELDPPPQGLKPFTMRLSERYG